MYGPVGIDPFFEAAARLRDRVVNVTKNNFGAQYELIAALIFFYFVENPKEFSVEGVRTELSRFDRTKLDDRLFCSVRFGLGQESIRLGKPVIDNCDSGMLEQIMKKVKYMTEFNVESLQQGLSSNTRLFVNTSDGPKTLKGTQGS